MHITSGHNGWTMDVSRRIKAIEWQNKQKLWESQAEERAVERERAELEYYEDNNCFPTPTGYFGTETDAHFYER